VVRPGQWLVLCGLLAAGCSAQSPSLRESALQAVREAKWEEAEKWLPRALAAHPDDADLLYAAGAVAAQAGRGQEAFRQLYAAIAAREDFPAARLFLARLLVEMEGVGAARRQVEEVLRRHPALAEALAAAATLWADDAEQVAAFWQRAAESRPDQPEWRLGFAQALLAANLLPEATRAFASLVETNQVALAAWTGLAETWLRRGNPDLQVRALTRAAGLPEAGLKVKAELARALLGHDDPDLNGQGGALLFALLDQAPEDPELNFLAATLFDDAGAHEEARLHYLTAIANGCTNPRAGLYLGEAYAKTDEPGRAREVLAAVAEAEPENSPWRRHALTLLEKLP
jgi:predicted Zn-dependent protease